MSTLSEIFPSSGAGNFLPIKRAVASVDLQMGQFVCSLGRPERGKTRIAVVATEAEAKELRLFIRQQIDKTEGGCRDAERLGVPVPSGVTIVQELLSQTNAQLARFCEWAKLDGDPTRASDADLVGRDFPDVSVAYSSGSGIVTTKAKVTVQSVDGEQATVSFIVGILEQTCIVPIASLAEAAGAADNVAVVPVELAEFFGKPLLDLIKSLPASSRLPARQYSMQEVVDVARPFSTSLSSVSAKWLDENKEEPRELLAVAALALSSIPAARIFALPACAKRVWPVSSAAELGGALATMWRKHSAMPPILPSALDGNSSAIDVDDSDSAGTSLAYAAWPHVGCLELRCASQAEFDSFLVMSADVTAPEHKQRIENDLTRKIASGQLERFIVGAEKRGVASASLAILKTGSKGLDSIDLFNELLSLVPDSAASKQGLTVGPSSMRVNVHQIDTSGSEQDRSGRNQLALDAAAIQADESMAAKLAQYKLLVAMPDKTELATTLVTETATQFTRIFSSTEDIDKALQGMHHPAAIAQGTSTAAHPHPRKTHARGHARAHAQRRAATCPAQPAVYPTVTTRDGAAASIRIHPICQCQSRLERAMHAHNQTLGPRQRNLSRVGNRPSQIVSPIGCVDQEIIKTFTAVRRALDARLVSALSNGKDVALIPTRVMTAVSNVRRGRLSSVKLGHLLDLDDVGTPSDPLKSFAAGSLSTADLYRALNKLQNALCKCQPTQFAAILSYFSEMQTAIEGYKKRGATLKDLSPWLAAVFNLAARPILRLASDESGGSQFCDFSLKAINSESPHKGDLEAAISKNTSKTAAADAVREAGSKSGPKGGTKSKKQKVAGEDDEPQPNDSAKSGGVEKKQGRAMPDDAAKQKIHDEHGKAKRPDGKGKPVRACVFFFHPDGKGCAIGDTCHFHHIKKP